MNMPKSNLRSFRYSDRVAEILEGFEGNSLNEKFENLVLYCFDEVPRTQRRLHMLNQEISSKVATLNSFDRQIRELDEMIKNIKSTQFYLGIVARGSVAMAEKMETELKKAEINENDYVKNISAFAANADSLKASG